MGVLATGTLLVLFGHVATGGLTTACLALGGPSRGKAALKVPVYLP
jgi:hypothetical protein